MSKQGWSVQDIPDQTGRVAVVTGATSGTGFEAAKALAGRGATVVLACRNETKALGAQHLIQTAHSGARVEIQALDLGSLRSVREAAVSIKQRFDRLDLLINNAGVMVPPYGKTEDGFELQLGTNHLGPFALTGLLLERITTTPGSRIVTMSSMAHRWGQVRFEDLHRERSYRAWEAYGQSKLANLLFTNELQRRLQAAGSGTLALAAHPGWARTELQRHAKQSRWMQALMSPAEGLLSQTAAAGALPILRAATDPALRGGEYFGPSGFREMKGHPVSVPSNRRSHDADLQRRLWTVSEQSTGVVYGI